MTGCTVRQYEQLETFPETIEQELRPAVCERRQTDRLKENYSIDVMYKTANNVSTFSMSGTIILPTMFQMLAVIQ